MADEPATPSVSSGKRRIPKACGSCRASKVRCDGQRPCSRCQNLRKVCLFVERPPDPQEVKIQNLERELQQLRQRVDSQQNDLFTATQTSPTTATDTSPSSMQDQASHIHTRHLQTQHQVNIPSRKRTRTQFEVEPSSIPNFVANGLISTQQTELFFNAFFQGCDRYVPIFDPLHDSFESINARSTLLANAIVTVGCGVLSEADSQTSNMLNFHLKKMLNLVIINLEYASLETVQALLVMACYSSERSLILAFATRMALDIGLPGAYEELTKSLVAQGTPSTAQIYNEEEATLMRRTRAWFQLMVLEQILRVDAGDLRSFQLRGEARRCRILLDRPYSTVLDLRLLSQVELNPLRAKAHDALSACDYLDDEEIVSIVRDAQIDLDIWYNDWEGIMKRSVTTETPVLLLNLEVQKYWSQTVVACRAVRTIGNDNITKMSAAQRQLLSMAKGALKKHLRVILDRPQNYLSHFRFAMDFVWAKCAFCFLLLLKLTRLLPETDDSPQHLLSDGYALLHELNKAGGGSTTGGGRSHSSRMYLQVLQLSVQKYGKAISGEQLSHSNYQDANLASAPQDSQSPLDFFWTSSHNGGHEIDAFIPEQFVFEWDFPGLTLFSSSKMADSLFDDFFAGFQGNIESLFYGMPG